MNMDRTEKYCMPGCVEQVLCSSHKQLEYRILIAVPGADPPERGYPVIYALDGDAVFGTLVEAARLQTRKPHGFDPAMIVGICYPSREPFDRNRRYYDFTTPAQAEHLPERPNGWEWPDLGGADAFLDFMEAELMPKIFGQYPVDRERQAIFGHSLGGLLVLHALFSRPQLFQHYIAGSPSIWWNNRAILQEKIKFETTLAEARIYPRLLITIGADELDYMVKDAEQLAESLEPLAACGFHSEMVKFADENHVSVLPAALSRLLKFTLGGA